MLCVKLMALETRKCDAGFIHFSGLIFIVIEYCTSHINENQTFKYIAIHCIYVISWNKFLYWPNVRQTSQYKDEKPLGYANFNKNII